MNKHFLLIPLALLLGCSSFEESDLIPEEGPKATRSNLNSEKLDLNPYSMEVMEQAVAQTQPARHSRNVQTGELEPTHLHIKFYPTTKHQFEVLKTNYRAQPFPLDNPPKVPSGNKYVESSGNPVEPDRLYALVSVTASMPDSIDYEILQFLYDPYSDSTRNTNTETAEAIVNTAFRISYAEIDSTPYPHPVSPFLPWYPSGTVKAWDDIARDYIPLEGVEVLINPETMIGSSIAITDENGHFTAKYPVKGYVSYAIDWQTDKWQIFKDSMHVAYTQTPTGLHGAYDIKIEKSGQSIYYATLHRGIYCYYYKAPSIGLLPPTVNYPLRIIANDVHTNPDGTAVGMFYPIPDYLHGKPDINIWCKGWDVHDLLAFIVHELAHAAHYKPLLSDPEMWAKCIITQNITMI